MENEYERKGWDRLRAAERGRRMGKAHYVECPNCRKEYYLESILYQTVMSNPKQNLKCPFCKKEFYLQTRKDLPSKK